MNNFLKRCASAQGDFAGESGFGEQLYDRTCEHEILLDLGIVGPRSVMPPCGDAGLGDHRSTSMSWFTSTPQRRSLMAPSTERPDCSATGRSGFFSSQA